MLPDEILENLNKLGVAITRRTLLNYEKWELISRPERGGGGPGGRWTNYLNETVYEAYAAWSLMNGNYEPEEKCNIFLSDKVAVFSPAAIKRAKECQRMSDVNSVIDLINNLVFQLWQYQVLKAKNKLEIDND